MKSRLASLATIAGYLGVVLFLVALVGRFYGERAVFGFKAMNVFLAGLGVITWGIWARLESR